MLGASYAKSCAKDGERLGDRHVNVPSHHEIALRDQQLSRTGFIAMNVLALTIFVGFVLVTLFVLLWLIHACHRHSFTDREALLPLEEDAPAPNSKPIQSPAQ